MKKIFDVLLFVLWLVPAVCISQTDSIQQYDPQINSLHIPVANGNPVLLDGIFSEGEWDDAAIIAVNEQITLRFKQFQGHVFIGIDCPDILAPVVDIFLAVDSTQMLQLHIAAQLGERLLFPQVTDREDARFVWGKISDWYANEFRWNSPMTDSLVRKAGKSWEESMKIASFDADGIELQIKQSKIPFDKWFFRFELGEGGNYDKPTVYPAGTEQKNINGWTKLVLKK